jgi:uncharacterized damage-inducible protein DinB
MQNIQIKNYLGQIKLIYNGEPWLEESFNKKLGQVSDEDAFNKPHGLHSIAEIVSHIVVWRKALLSRLKKDNSFDLSMESELNWRANDELKSLGWNSLKTELDQTQIDIISFLETKTDNFLLEDWNDNFTNQYLIEGWIHHDIYHLGQLGIIIRLRYT